MAFFKTHAAKVLPHGTIAMCWNTKAEIITADESQVDCKKCLNAIAFNRQSEAEWKAKRAEVEKGGGA